MPEYFLSLSAPLFVGQTSVLHKILLFSTYIRGCYHDPKLPDYGGVAGVVRAGAVLRRRRRVDAALCHITPCRRFNILYFTHANKTGAQCTQLMFCLSIVISNNINPFCCGDG